MAEKLNKIVKFRGDRLFNGAVNISWANDDAPKAKLASESFVFHGPKYHGITQEDVGVSHGHKLVDTASFAMKIARRCYGHEEQPFTMAIAGYGTGKSHLALTLATLLGNPTSETSNTIIDAVKAADPEIGNELGLLFQEAPQPCLAITINGMQGFDLAAEVSRQIASALKNDKLDTKPLADLRPRFIQAASLTRLCNDALKSELLAALAATSLEQIIQDLEQQNEITYAKVHDFFAAKGIPIAALRGESIRDIIEITTREYCGPDKPYRSLVLLFDEFGKYTEFATVKSQIAGNGVLQDLFEAVQANSAKACFVGFIQFELNAYVQRVAPELRNEILRYITRFQNVNKLYLSINLETLIASLLEKIDRNRLQALLRVTKGVSQDYMDSINSWFPNSRNYRVWSDPTLFHQIIREGCWPLSPYSTWFLFYLAAAGKHLQERSALAILGEVMQRFENKTVSDVAGWSIAPAELWSDVLQQEFITSEEAGQQGSITHSYASAISKHGARFTAGQVAILRAVVIASKLGLVAGDKIEAVKALGQLAGLDETTAENEIKQLQEEYNLIEWDNSFKAFDIVGDAVPRTQFIAFLRQKVSSAFDETAKAQLFTNKAKDWFSNVFVDLDSDFAEENRITTQEWKFQCYVTNSLVLPQIIKMAIDRWLESVEVDKPRGTIIYTYVTPSENIDEIKKKTTISLRQMAKESGYKNVPVIVVFLNDEIGELGKNFAEYHVLESMTESDKLRFGNLVGAHKEKLFATLQEQIESLLRARIWVAGLEKAPETRKLRALCTEIFKEIYPNPITFPFDGFNTARGNAADTCHELIRELVLGKLDYNGIMVKPEKVKNRAITVLNQAWKIFNKNGTISRRPENTVINGLSVIYDDLLNKDGKFSLPDCVKQLCLPPYGANLASAGLFLGAYIAPRSEKIVVVKGNREISFSQWVKDDLFKGHYIHLPLLQDTFIVQQGEASSEWELLLDEWEHCASHDAKLKCYQRAQDLKTRKPLPSVQAYREDALSQQTQASFHALRAFDKEFKEALSKAEMGSNKKDVGSLSHGVALMNELQERMIGEGMWLDSQINEITPHIETGRQMIIQIFSEWLPMQTPRNATPSEVGDFKHIMLKKIGANLKSLKLDDEYAQLETHTSSVIKNAEIIAEAHQLVHSAKNWVTTYASTTRLARVAEIRALFQTGKDFANKLRGMAQRAQLSEINETRTTLFEFVKKLKDCEEDLVKRNSNIWDAKISSESDIDKILGEIENLVAAFEGLPEDLEDLHLMRKMLRLYRSFHQRLADFSLNWAEFEATAKNCQTEAEKALGEDEIPWSPEDIVEMFYKSQTKIRKERSQAWLDEIENSSSSLATMSAAEANSLLNKLNAPPSFIADSHMKSVKKLITQLTKRLEALEVEWLVEKFKELPVKTKLEFMKTAQKILDKSNS